MCCPFAIRWMRLRRTSRLVQISIMRPQPGRLYLHYDDQKFATDTNQMKLALFALTGIPSPIQALNPPTSPLLTQASLLTKPITYHPVVSKAQFRKIMKIWTESLNEEDKRMKMMAYAFKASLIEFMDGKRQMNEIDREHIERFEVDGKIFGKTSAGELLLDQICWQFRYLLRRCRARSWEDGGGRRGNLRFRGFVEWGELCVICSRQRDHLLTAM